MAARSRGSAACMRVADGVERFEDQGVVNWYLVETGDGVVAVDAGFPTAWKHVRPRLRELRAVVLTHGHIDHTGFAPKAAREGVPVYVPRGDEPIVRSPIPFASSERNPAPYVLRHGPTRRLYLRALLAGGVLGQTLRDFQVYGDGDELPGGLRAVATPGHTKGHTALHLPDRDVVFVGDAIVMKDPYTDRPGPRLVARAATWDVERNLASLDAVSATGAGTVLTGHGEPFTGGAAVAAEQARRNGSA
jgi:glyoxylase-like metal-dependent hydrolase (beta-lactamase superfamily II)